jgi:hypothetical protein
MGGPVFGSPAVVGETVLVTDFARYVSALDRRTGEVLWRFRTGGQVKSSPVVLDGVVYLGSDDGRIYALETGLEPTPQRAVFWDEDLGGFTTLVRAESIMSHFRARGYEVVDRTALVQLMEDRIADGRRSVVVFAQDWLPAEVVDEARGRSLVRAYLDAGGKMVWLGYPPLAIGRDPETGAFVDYDLSRSEALLGVAYEMAGDDYGVRVTSEGEAWGLPRWWTALGGIDPTGVSRVLGLDENGRAASWAKEYGGPPGTGFVHLQSSLSETDLDAIVRAAEYGIIR